MFVFQKVSVDEYFGGRRLTTQDRLGSVGNYYPYGESRSGTVSNADSFASYYRDSTGLDYAQQRYLSSGHGRFLTPDPYQASAGVHDPASWNRFAYVQNDPVNWNDPIGLFLKKPDEPPAPPGPAPFVPPNPGRPDLEQPIQEVGEVPFPESLNTSTRRRARSALDSLKEQFKRDLDGLGMDLNGAQGPVASMLVSLTAVTNLTSGANFFFVNGEDGGMTLSQVTGMPTMGSTTLSAYFTQAQQRSPDLAGLAVTAINSAGVERVLPVILLGGTYVNASEVSQNAILLHELTHVVFSGLTGSTSHIRLAEKLNLGSFASDSLASRELNRYFESCLQ